MEHGVRDHWQFDPALVCRLLALRPDALRCWLDARGWDLEQPLSFRQVIELAALRSLAGARTREHACGFARQLAVRLHDDTPLARYDVLSAPEAFLRMDERRASGRRRWWTGPALGRHVDRLTALGADLDFDAAQRYPTRWWIAGRDRPFVVEPAVQGGHPVLAGTRVRADRAAAVPTAQIGEMSRQWGVNLQSLSDARSLDADLRARLV
jgi:hypothetical protein